MKLDKKRVFLIGLSLMGVSMIWAIFNITVPIYLQNLGLTGLGIGAIMAIDNIFAIVFQPIFGALSERASTPYGKRVPYLLIGIPISAICFFLIPIVFENIALLVIMVAVLAFFISVFRTPAMGLLYDLVPSGLQGSAQGSIQRIGTMGALGAVIMAAFLYPMKAYYPFAVVSILSVLVIILLYNLVKEPSKEANDQIHETENETNEVVETLEIKAGRLSRVFLVLGMFFWFAAFGLIESFFSIYAKTALSLDIKTIFFMFAVMHGAMLVFSILSSQFANHFGRRKIILSGLGIVALAFLGLLLTRNITIVFLMMGLLGIGSAFIHVHTVVMAKEMIQENRVTKYMGVSFVVYMLASIISPVLFGFLKEGLKDNFLFVYGLIGIITAFFFMMLVKHGDAESKKDAKEDDNVEVLIEEAMDASSTETPEAE